jgi:hypothetical protein
MPQRAQQGEQQEGLLTIEPWASAGTGRQRGRTAPLSKPDRQLTHGEQMEASNEREGVDVQGQTEMALRAVIGWGRDGYLSIKANRQHVGLTSRPREQASPRVSLPQFHG